MRQRQGSRCSRMPLVSWGSLGKIWPLPKMDCFHISNNKLSECICSVVSNASLISFLDKRGPSFTFLRMMTKQFPKWPPVWEGGFAGHECWCPMARTHCAKIYFWWIMMRMKWVVWCGCHPTTQMLAFPPGEQMQHYPSWRIPQTVYK